MVLKLIVRLKRFIITHSYDLQCLGHISKSQMFFRYYAGTHMHHVHTIVYSAVGVPLLAPDFVLLYRRPRELAVSNPGNSIN